MGTPILEKGEPLSDAVEDGAEPCELGAGWLVDAGERLDENCVENGEFLAEVDEAVKFVVVMAMGVVRGHLYRLEKDVSLVTLLSSNIDFVDLNRNHLFTQFEQILSNWGHTF